MTRRPSAQTIAVLQALAADPTAWRHGYELGQEIGLKAGSLYPILIRLSDRGLLESSWERETTAGRPPRHRYRLTGDGVAYAGEHSPQPADHQRVVRATGGTAATTAPRLAGGEAR